MAQAVEVNKSDNNNDNMFNHDCIDQSIYPLYVNKKLYIALPEWKDKYIVLFEPCLNKQLHLCQHFSLLVHGLSANPFTVESMREEFKTRMGPFEDFQLYWHDPIGSGGICVCL